MKNPINTRNLAATIALVGIAASPGCITGLEPMAIGALGTIAYGQHQTIKATNTRVADLESRVATIESSDQRQDIAIDNLGHGIDDLRALYATPSSVFGKVDRE